VLLHVKSSILDGFDRFASMKLLPALLALVIAPLAHAQGVTAVERQVCRATVATLYGRDPKIMKVDGNQGPVIFVSYVRPNDGTFWASKCKVDGNRVAWGNRDGRWRDNPLDEAVEYKITPTEVTITVKFQGQVTNTRKYPVKDLGS